MKKLTVIISILLICTLTNTVNAHPGRLDSSGGHNCTEKSIAKGLCSSYHSHTDDSDSGDLDPIVDNKDPISEPVGPSPEEIAQQDTLKGEKEGSDSGYDDGYEAAVKDPDGYGTDAYSKGYETGYLRAYEEGKKKLLSDKKEAAKKGSALGKKQDSVKIPTDYSKNEELSKAFKRAFDQAVINRDTLKKNEYSELGYKDGKKDITNGPKNTKDIYLTAYQEGYEKGQKELMDRYYKQGYKAALTTLVYKAPKLEKEKYINWYKDGFESNEEVKKIQKLAFNLGENGDEYIVPEEHTKSEIIFKHYYEMGVEKKQKDDIQAAGGWGVILLGWLARRFYIARKMIS